jgi:hypothetical protein
MFKRGSCSDEYESDESEPSEFVQRLEEIIFAAKKLRHPILFSECFIHLVARLHNDEFYKPTLPALHEDKGLWLLLNEGKSHLRQMILQAQHGVLMASLDGHLQKEDLETSMTLAFREDPETSAEFFKHLLNLREQLHRGDYKEIGDMFPPIEKLIRSNLTLDQTGFGAGEGPYENSFLCTELVDEDMP